MNFYESCDLTKKVYLMYRYFIWPLLHLQNTLDLGILFLVRYITLIYQFYACTRQKVNAQGKLIQAKAIYFLQKKLSIMSQIYFPKQCNIMKETKTRHHILSVQINIVYLENDLIIILKEHKTARFRQYFNFLIFSLSQL